MRELKDKRQDASWERVVEKHVFHSVFPLASLKGEPGWERNRQEMFVCLFVQNVVCDGSSHLSFAREPSESSALVNNTSGSISQMGNVKKYSV